MSRGTVHGQRSAGAISAIPQRRHNRIAWHETRLVDGLVITWGAMSATESLGIMAKSKKRNPVSRSVKSGLILPVTKLNRHLKLAGLAKRTGSTAAVYLAAVLEYAANEIFESAALKLGKRKRVMPTDVIKAIRSDAELNRLLGASAVFSGDRVKGVSEAVTLKKL